MPAQAFEIGDEVLRGVYFEIHDVLDRRTAASTAALINDDDSVDLRIEEAAISRAAAGTGPAVQVDDGTSIWISRALPVHLLGVAHGE